MRDWTSAPRALEDARSDLDKGNTRTLRVAMAFSSSPSLDTSRLASFLQRPKERETRRQRRRKSRLREKSNREEGNVLVLVQTLELERLSLLCLRE